MDRDVLIMWRKAAVSNTYYLNKTFGSFTVSKTFTCFSCFHFYVTIAEKSLGCKTANENFKFKKGLGTFRYGFCSVF